MKQAFWIAEGKHTGLSGFTECPFKTSAYVSIAELCGMKGA